MKHSIEIIKKLLRTAFILMILNSCSRDSEVQGTLGTVAPTIDCTNNEFNFGNEVGCDGKKYPNPDTSPYVIPFPPGSSFETGLTNCSTSYHSPDRPDRYAFDFDVREGTKFYASRAGIVVHVVNHEPSAGGGVGNFVVIDHRDGTFALYLHSPQDGISVNIGETVEQGQLLGVTGRSGLAGYAHLHLIVVQNNYQWPYDPIPITFRNIVPADVIVKSNTNYKACEY